MFWKKNDPRSCVLTISTSRCTNSSILAVKPAYTLIGTYQDHSAGLQKLMEIGTRIGDKAYSVQYIADAPKYSDYLTNSTKDD